LPAQQQQPLCDKDLLNQSSVAECAGKWWFCGEAPVGMNCCDHWHESMNWKTIHSAGFHTGKAAGNRKKKYYQYKTQMPCIGSQCSNYPISKDPDHFEWDWTLVNCQ